MENTDCDSNNGTPEPKIHQAAPSISSDCATKIHHKEVTLEENNQGTHNDYESVYRSTGGPFDQGTDKACNIKKNDILNKNTGKNGNITNSSGDGRSLLKKKPTGGHSDQTEEILKNANDKIQSHSTTDSVSSRTTVETEQEHDSKVSFMAISTIGKKGLKSLRDKYGCNCQEQSLEQRGTKRNTSETCLDKIRDQIENGIFDASLFDWYRTNKNLENPMCTDKLGYISDYIDKLQKKAYAQQIYLQNKDDEIKAGITEFTLVLKDANFKNPIKSNNELQKFGTMYAYETESVKLRELAIICRNLFEEKNRNIYDQETKLRSLKRSLDNKTEELEESYRNMTVLQNQIQNLHNQLNRITRVSKSQINDLKFESSNYQKSINNLSQKINKYCHNWSIEDIQEKTQASEISGALERIDNLKEELEDYRNQINEFCGSPKDKQYQHFKDMLIKINEKLDAIDGQNRK